MKPAEAVQFLLESEWSEARIAARIGTSQPTVHRMKRGRQPLWDAGDAVIALAKAVIAGSPRGLESKGEAAAPS